LSIVFELRLVFSYQRRLLTHPALNAYHILQFNNLAMRFIEACSVAFVCNHCS